MTAEEEATQNWTPEEKLKNVEDWVKWQYDKFRNLPGQKNELVAQTYFDILTYIEELWARDNPKWDFPADKSYATKNKSYRKEFVS